MWESQEFPDLFPLAIPDHGGKDISPGTQRTILNLLEDDVLRWEEQLDEEAAARENELESAEDELNESHEENEQGGSNGRG
jgi:hypothetical protein